MPLIILDPLRSPRKSCHANVQFCIPPRALLYKCIGHSNWCGFSNLETRFDTHENDEVRKRVQQCRRRTCFKVMHANCRCLMPQSASETLVKKRAGNLEMTS